MGSAAKEHTGGIDLHADHTHSPPGGFGEHGLGERHPMDISRVECHQDGVEIEPRHGFEQDSRVVMPGDPEKSDAALLACLDGAPSSSAFATEDRLQIAGGAQVMELPEVEVIGARARPRLSSRSRSEPSRVRSWVLDARKTWLRRSPRAAP